MNVSSREQPGLRLFTWQLKFPRGAKRQVLKHHHFSGLCLYPGYQWPFVRRVTWPNPESGVGECHPKAWVWGNIQKSWGLNPLGPPLKSIYFQDNYRTFERNKYHKARQKITPSFWYIVKAQWMLSIIAVAAGVRGGEKYCSNFCKQEKISILNYKGRNFKRIISSTFLTPQFSQERGVIYLVVSFISLMGGSRSVMAWKGNHKPCLTCRLTEMTYVSMIRKVSIMILIQSEVNAPLQHGIIIPITICWVFTTFKTFTGIILFYLPDHLAKIHLPLTLIYDIIEPSESNSPKITQLANG